MVQANPPGRADAPIPSPPERTQLDGTLTVAAADLGIVHADPAAGRLLGHAPEALAGRCVLDLVPARLREPHREALERWLAGGFASRWDEPEFIVLREDGAEARLHISMGLWQDNGRAFFTAVLRDPQHEDREKQTLVASELRYRELFERSVAGVYRVGLDGTIYEMNDAMAGFLGYTSAVAIRGAAAQFYFDPADRRAWIDALLEHNSLTNYVLKLRRRDGGAVWTLENCALSYDAEAGQHVILGTAIDITERKALEESLERMAYNDPLTGVANRRMLLEMTEKAIARTRREGGHLAMLYVDLLRFKRVNDLVGHFAGDQVLREVAARFASIVRATDTLARIGGDEFAVLLVSVAGVHQAVRPARQLRECLSRPFVIQDEVFHIDARIGIALYPDHGADFDELLTRADLAVHQKSPVEGEIYLYRPMAVRPPRDELVLEERLRKALRNEEFELHYQPVYRVEDRKVMGVEALARWRQADGRVLGAGEFISIAEHTGLVRSLDRWAVGAAARQLAEWPGDAVPPWVALNVTPATFQDDEFPVLVARAIEREGITGQALGIEMTERLTMRDPERAASLLQDLKALGLRILIDDFGRGHSSLAYLKDFPVDVLKVDRYFVGHIGKDHRHERLLEGILALAAGLGIELIAEGVETTEQLEWLEQHGCKLVQGYLLSEPVAAGQVPGLVTGAPRFVEAARRTA
jgi:diguanylate cyclase (GGDEF)-like protein/PAS domain S-box-containing protein